MNSEAMLTPRQTSQPALTDPIDADKIVVGRDILELISTAMYVDPMTVYREYVQNAADAIEEARAIGIISANEPGLVDFQIDASTRSVRIRDNGRGIPRENFVRILTAIGASAKRGTTARGFRGVGRLAGLGYAQELIFRTRAEGEELSSELRWDCRKFRAQLRESDPEADITHLIQSIVSVSRKAFDDYPKRFFEVELRGIVRLRSDKLMSAVAIAQYLSQVAPVPFAPEFRFGAEIRDRLSEHVQLAELEIRIGGNDCPLYRPHRDVLALDGHRPVTFRGVTFANPPSIDQGTAAVAWFLHHDYEGSLPAATLVDGLRMRAGNIQVGDNVLLEELFSESRFNGWSVGEIHVVDRRIIPNGRRDNFEQNGHLSNLLNQLSPPARDIARRCRTSSTRRKLLRDFEITVSVAREKAQIVAQGSLGKASRSALAAEVSRALGDLDKLAGNDALALDVDTQLQPTIDAFKNELKDLLTGVVPAAPLAHLKPKEQKLYQHVFELIYECSTNRVAAKALVDRMLEKLG